ncbi:YhbY family RNA-binding protein [candidate division KSB1 bacterium]|nr:YhbY family RNA-binding protein [candidate division KSB1 bacterium]
MLPLKNYQKKYLRGLGNQLKPVIYIGKNGLSEQVLNSINDALEIHELIKLKYIEFREQRNELNKQITEKINCEIAGQTGFTTLFFRRNPDKAKQKIKLPE